MYSTVIDRSTVASAFVGPDAKTVWLNGVHARTQVKADSKTLTGLALEYELDPLGDQTYSLSAIRSQPEVIGLLKGTRQAVVGVAPSASRVWLGRPGDWSGFVAQTEALLTHLAAPPAASTLYRFLSQPVTSGVGVKDAYAVAVLPSALLAEEAAASPEQRGEGYRLWGPARSFGRSPQRKVFLGRGVTDRFARRVRSRCSSPERGAPSER